jgi:hypothetical protein
MTVKIGDRVQLRWWMRGARYGEVTKLGTKYVHVRLDRIANFKIVRLNPENIMEVYERIWSLT